MPFQPSAVTDLRKRLELSQWDLAKILGVTSATIHNWERGRCVPSSQTIDRLYQLCGQKKITPPEFFIEPSDPRMIDEQEQERAIWHCLALDD